MKTFQKIIGNNLLSNVTNLTVWFALTFWIYLETYSVFATGMISGMYLVFTAGFGFWFGSIVDRSLKKSVMVRSSVASAGFYALSLVVLQISPSAAFKNPYDVNLWLLVLLVMLGVTAGNLRTIALPTLVTLLVPEDGRDKANGLVGMVNGIGYLVTSVISGFLVAWGGMVITLALALAFTLLALLHLSFVVIKEEELPRQHLKSKNLDIMGTIALVMSIPGLLALICFTTFNNFLSGIFVALLDAYSLSLMSVQSWGLLFGVLSGAYVISGLVISKTGLGRNPLKTLLYVSLIEWASCAIFALQSSIWLLAGGCLIWMIVGPYAEAAEQTVLQKVILFERQGRVFGFAQSVEQAASPLSALLVGPFAQFFVIPFMTNGAGAYAIGPWFGTGAPRGIALVFTVVGLFGMIITLLIMQSTIYRQLSAVYVDTGERKGSPA